MKLQALVAGAGDALAIAVVESEVGGDDRQHDQVADELEAGTDRGGDREFLNLRDGHDVERGEADDRGDQRQASPGSSRPRKLERAACSGVEPCDSSEVIMLSCWTP